MFTSAAVIFLQNQEDDTLDNYEENNQKVEGKFNNLTRNIEQISYRIDIHYLWQGTDLEATLTEFLKVYDIVMTIGNITEELFTTVANVYDEHWSEGCGIKSKERCNNTEYKYCHIIEEIQSFVLKLHRFYFIDLNCTDFTQLLKQLESFTKRAVYSKVFQYNASDEKAKAYVDKLLNNGGQVVVLTKENGIQTRKQSENEVIICSASINEINAVHQHFIDNFAIENSYVLEEFEENILNSPSLIIQEAIQCIQECFDRYEPENVFISFNGGKDCTVLLHLMMLILNKYYPHCNRPVFCMYVQSKKPFPQVTAFIEKLQCYYDLDMHTLTLDIKDGLSAILQERPNLKACLMGTRRSDPFSAHLNHFQATDNGWPELMRVSPLLDWEFAHIWDYLLSFKVPYCCLYDEGYTSLGNVDNTLRNPQLLDETNGEYYPAYRLLKSAKERSGRT